MFIVILVVALIVAAIAGTITLIANDGYVAAADRMWTSNLEAPSTREAPIARFA